MKLDLATRTLFSEFQEIVFSRTALEKKIKQTRTYVKKTVKNRVYWYKQHYENGQAKQSYFGPANKQNNDIVSKERAQLKKDKMLVKKLISQEQRQAAMLHKGGLPILDRRTALIVGKLSDSFLIYQYGILVGTLAFSAYSGLLGTVFDKTTLRTQDIDIVRDDSIEIAVAGVVNADKFFSQPGLQCSAVPPLSPKALPSSFVTSDGIRIDFLVPLKGKEKKNVKMPSVIGAGAQSIRFLDFLIEEPIKTVLLSPTGGIPVTVPSPYHFAIHKLIVAQYRSATENAKREKDLHQAQQLILALSEEQPVQLKSAYKRAINRGKKWQSALKRSLGTFSDILLP